MDIEKLKQAYSQNAAVRAICDHMAARDKNQNETKFHRIWKHLANDCHDLKRSDLIAAFQSPRRRGLWTIRRGAPRLAVAIRVGSQEP
jgi:hypothetical protein